MIKKKEPISFVGMTFSFKKYSETISKGFLTAKFWMSMKFNAFLVM